MSLKHLKSLTVIDFLIIVLVILALILLIKFLFPQQEWINVSVYSEKAPFYITQSLRKGQVEVDLGGKTIAVINNVETNESYRNTLQDFQTSKPLIDDSRKELFLDVKILVTKDLNRNEFKYKNKVIKVGSQITFLFNDSLVTGYIKDINEKSTLETKIITLELYGEPEWKASAINNGDGEYDDNGAKILEVIEKQITEVPLNQEYGLKKINLKIKAKILVKKHLDGFFYKEYRQILVGKTLSFQTNYGLFENWTITKVE